MKRAVIYGLSAIAVLAACCGVFQFYQNKLACKDAERGMSEPLPVDTSLKFIGNKQMCGPNCLALISYGLGLPVAVEKVADLAGASKEKGTTMLGLAKAASTLGLKCKGLKVPLWKYKQTKGPVIAHLLLDKNEGHFVVLNGYNADEASFSIIDPPNGTVLIPEKEMSRAYTGNLLFVWR